MNQNFVAHFCLWILIQCLSMLLTETGQFAFQIIAERFRILQPRCRAFDSQKDKIIGLRIHLIKTLNDQIWYNKQSPRRNQSRPNIAKTGFCDLGGLLFCIRRPAVSSCWRVWSRKTSGILRCTRGTFKPGSTQSTTPTWYWHTYIILLEIGNPNGFLVLHLVSGHNCRSCTHNNY